VREFVDRELAPHLDAWEHAGRIDPKLWRTAGERGLLGLTLPEEYRGGGCADYRFRCVVMDELARAGAASANVALAGFDDLLGPYLVASGPRSSGATGCPACALGNGGARSR
jgi:alkylation response protein AidB-like acyl-CoA dehydrogenase